MICRNVKIKNVEQICDYLVAQKIVSPCFSLKEPQGNLVHMVPESLGHCEIREHIHDSENVWFAIWTDNGSILYYFGVLLFTKSHYHQCS